MENYLNVKSLEEWQKIILEVRGVTPTKDSEIMLLKMVDDITRINPNMISYKKILTEMIYWKFMEID